MTAQGSGPGFPSQPHQAYTGSTLAGPPSHQDPPTHARLYLEAPDGECALAGYRVECAGPLTGQHILNKSKARGNAEVRAILARCPEEVMAQVCAAHNVDRWADQKDAQRILLLQQVYRFGWARMRSFLNTLPWKVPHPELTIEGILE